MPVPAVSDYQLLTSSTTPPTEADCYAIGRRCFTAAAMQASYNLPSLYAEGDEGQGMTIAIIDSFGNPNMASDLAAPGMATTVEIKTGSRTILSYLLSPLLRYRQETLRER